MNRLRLGIDIGSVSISGAILDDNLNIVESIYVRHRGDPIDCATSEIARLNDKYAGLSLWGLTGGGAKQLAKSLGAPYINEFSALSAA
ncbi:MAG: 2-hydroxyglutaryl-CoA dehydratase, partial [Calditrichia bacterium]